jgi:hypothetical protein
MTRHAVVFIILAAALTGGVDAGGADRAEDILRQAREALGGETQLGAVRSLSLTGALRRVTEDQDVDGRIDLALLLPDKFRRDETIRVMGNDGPTLIAAWDGTAEWRDVRTDALAGGVQIVRRAAPAPSGAAGAAPRPPAIPHTKADMIRLALATLLTAPASTQVSFTYAGPVETDAGKAEALDATGPDGFQMRIYFDAGTHRPMAVAYRTVEGPRAVFRAMRAGSAPPANAAPEQPPAPREVDVHINLGEFRKSGGVLLPHRFEKMVDGKLVEEWTIEKAQVNATIEPSRFVNKK